MTESIDFVLVIAGFLIAASGHVWLLCRVFQVSDLWGAVLFFLPALVPFYALAALRRCWAPLLVMLLGVGLVAAPTGIRLYQNRYIDLGERVKDVNGEQHVTLTGWDKKDYSVLARLPETVVLQMANPDVTDETLHHLKGMTKLRELDLNDTEISDEGLKLLAQLSALEQLRLKGTSVTDAGFRQSLMPLQSLTFVEWTGTAIHADTLKAWKAAKPGRRTIPRVK
jgi:hypothetical protein